MGMSGQLHAPATVLPGKEPLFPQNRQMGPIVSLDALGKQ